MVNRNQGAGTRILIDRLLGSARPTATGTSPLAQRGRRRGGAEPRRLGHDHRAGRACRGLGFIPLAEEHYDFALVSARKDRPAVQAFYSRWRRKRAAMR